MHYHVEMSLAMQPPKVLSQGHGSKVGQAKKKILRK